MMEHSTKTVLVIDDETSICEMLTLALKKWGYRSRIAQNFKEGLAALERGKVDAVLSDVKLPDGSGVDLLLRSKTLPEKLPVILMTAFGDTDSAVKAMEMGAFYYVTKPFKLEELKNILEKALKRNAHESSTASPSTATKAAKAKNVAPTKPELVAAPKMMIGSSSAMKELYKLIDRLSHSKTNVLITGESGTGKELIARAIHLGGPLKSKPFVAINCGAIPENLIESELFGYKKGAFTGAVADKEGLFQVADGGSLFLDEVGELPMHMQVKLLRVLQDKVVRPVGGTENSKIDVRVISATNRNLEKMVHENTFREDLYYRLNVIHVKTTPLRERKEDLEELVHHFVQKMNLSMGKNIAGVSAEAMEALLAYSFPGNIRELENTIERAMALEIQNDIQVTSLPPQLLGSAELRSSLSAAGSTVEEVSLKAKRLLQRLSQENLGDQSIIGDFEKMIESIQSLGKKA